MKPFISYAGKRQNEAQILFSILCLENNSEHLTFILVSPLRVGPLGTQECVAGLLPDPSKR